MEVCTGENKKDRNCHGMSDRHCCTVFPSVRSKTGVLCGEESLIVSNGRFCTLGKSGFQGFVAIGGFTAFAFAGTFVAAGSHTDPIGKNVLVSEIAHVCACFSNDLFRTDKADDTQNLVQLPYGALLPALKESLIISSVISISRVCSRMTFIT